MNFSKLYSKIDSNEEEIMIKKKCNSKLDDFLHAYDHAHTRYVINKRRQSISEFVSILKREESFRAIYALIVLRFVRESSSFNGKQKLALYIYISDHFLRDRHHAFTAWSLTSIFFFPSYCLIYFFISAEFFVSLFISKRELAIRYWSYTRH